MSSPLLRPAVVSAALKRDFDRLWGDLAPVGRDPTGGYRRLAYTDTDLTLREWFQQEGAARSMDVDEDRAGNLWAWWGDPTAGGAVATGSHLDSVRRGGAYDGPLGVVSGFLAIDELRARGVEPQRPVTVAAFADEEGARFGVACAGSRLLTGSLDAARALALTDDDGVTMREALRRSGRDPGRLGRDPKTLGRVGCFVELHVEQGRGLVDLGVPVGLGDAIRAHGRWRFDLDGRADHAGTTRLEDRDDPMLRAAQLVLEARAAAEANGALATVGRVRPEPNGVNAIAHLIQVWLDARADEEQVVRETLARIATVAGVEPVEESWTPRVDLDGDLRNRLRTALGATHGDLPVLSTGAGHDAGILADAGVPTAMLFVRNPTGVSHAPEEQAERADCLLGVAALADAIEHLVRS